MDEKRLKQMVAKAVDMLSKSGGCGCAVTSNRVATIVRAMTGNQFSAIDIRRQLKPPEYVWHDDAGNGCKSTGTGWRRTDEQLP